MLLAGAVALLGGWAVTRPVTVDADAIAGLAPDLARGEVVFHEAGCASCHSAPGAQGAERLVLSGGRKLDTPAGVFHVPNISQDKAQGIGGWSRAEVVTAIMHGVDPEGRHLYPAFPYPAYTKAEPSDIVSLAAYLETLPADPTPSQPHELSFPYSIRAGIGAWKLLNLSQDYAVPVSGEAAQRGQYVAEALAHCGECHTPRDATQGLDTARWMAGAPNPSGKGRVPNVTPGGLDWSEEEIAAFLSSGFTPDYDVASGDMAEVIEELKQLPEGVTADLAAYLKAIPAVKSEAAPSEAVPSN